jgi:hypothetical protein
LLCRNSLNNMCLEPHNPKRLFFFFFSILTARRIYFPQAYNGVDL